MDRTGDIKLFLHGDWGKPRHYPHTHTRKGMAWRLPAFSLCLIMFSPSVRLLPNMARLCSMILMLPSTGGHCWEGNPSGIHHPMVVHGSPRAVGHPCAVENIGSGDSCLCSSSLVMKLPPPAPTALLFFLVRYPNLSGGSFNSIKRG